VTRFSTGTLVVLAAAALCACHSHYRKAPMDAADPAGPWGAGLESGERARLIETDGLIRGELSVDAWSLERLDMDARALGLSGAAELTAALERDCLEPEEIGKFAAARGLSEETAERYLAARFDAGTCGAPAR